MEEGTIEGRVMDKQGDVLPGVVVTATSDSIQGQRTTVTNAEGQYRFPLLSPGQYELTAMLTGFHTQRVSDVVVRVGRTVEVNFTLELATAHG